MRLRLISGYSGAHMGLPMDLILEAEKSGFDSVWTAEAYGSDAITPLAWIGALTKKIRLGTGIMQMPARTPAMTAMTAMTLDALSGGRFILGIGPSGPQVVEGWHGVSYGKPLQRTREYIEIVRTILAREVPSSITARNSPSRIPVPARVVSANRSRAFCTAAKICRFTRLPSVSRASSWRRRLPMA